VANFGHFVKSILEKNILSQIPCFFDSATKKRSQKGPSIAYNMKGCLRFSAVMFPKLPNFGQIQVKQHHKMGKKEKKKKKH
jgi:hypothetical protein